MIAKELLHAEGFTNVRYVETPEDFTIPELVGRGEVHFGSTFAGTVIDHIDDGVPILALAGVHSGCYELFAHEPFRSITELRGRKLVIKGLNSDGHQYLSIMAAHVGLDPKTDFDWVISPGGDALEVFARGEADAFLAFPPEPQELRHRKIGRVIISTVQDKPWSQYFCCLLFGAKDYVRNYPNATKRYLRALLKAADICSDNPERVARQLKDDGFARYDYARQTLDEIRYRDWRYYSAEDSMRFFALRLHEAGMIRKSPNQFLADSTEWRFFSELKRELKT